MTQAEFGTYLVFAAGVSLILAIVNAFRGRFMLAGGCLAVSGALILYRGGSSEAVVGLAGIVAGIFLVLDMVIRVRRPPGGTAKK